MSTPSGVSGVVSNTRPRDGQLIALLTPAGAVLEMAAAIGRALPAGDLTGRLFWDLPLWDQPTRELLREQLQAVATGHAVQEEVRLQWSGAEDATATLTFRVIQAGGGDVGAIVVEAEGALGSPADGAPEGHDAVSAEFLDELAHQLNNALASISGNLELIERRCDGNAAVLARIPRMQEALSRAFVLIERLRSK